MGAQRPRDVGRVGRDGRDASRARAEHERIASDWDATLSARLAALSVTVSKRTLAAFNAAVQAEWSSWLAEHQAAQDAIDPFTAILDCSGPESEESEESEGSGPGVEGETVEEE